MNSSHLQNSPQTHESEHNSTGSHSNKDFKAQENVKHTSKSENDIKNTTNRVFVGGFPNDTKESKSSTR